MLVKRIICDLMINNASTHWPSSIVLTSCWKTYRYLRAIARFDGRRGEVTWLWDEEKSLVSGAGVVWGGQMNDGEVDGDAENIALTASELQEEQCNGPFGRVVGNEVGQREADADAPSTSGSPQDGMYNAGSCSGDGCTV